VLNSFSQVALDDQSFWKRTSNQPCNLCPWLVIPLLPSLAQQREKRENKKISCVRQMQFLHGLTNDEPAGVDMEHDAGFAHIEQDETAFPTTISAGHAPTVSHAQYDVLTHDASAEITQLPEAVHALPSSPPIFQPARLMLVGGDVVDVLIKAKSTSEKELQVYEQIGPHHSICRFWRLWDQKMALERGACNLFELMHRDPGWVRANVKLIARQCFEGMLHFHRCGRNLGDFKTTNVVCFPDRFHRWCMKLIDVEHSEKLSKRLDRTYFTTPGHVPTHRPASPMAYDLWAFRTFLLQLVTPERFNVLWCSNSFGAQANPKDPVGVLLRHYRISIEQLVPDDLVLREILRPGRVVQNDTQAEQLSSEISNWFRSGN
jgi:hypothetical protein